jgi:hypothetical protein
VDARFDPRAIDSDRLKVFDDHVNEISATEIGRVETPQLTDAHFAGVVDG